MLLSNEAAVETVIVQYLYKWLQVFNAVTSNLFYYENSPEKIQILRFNL